MAKKVVASFKGDKSTAKNRTKCVKMVKSPKSGSYAFVEEIIPNEEVKAFFA